MKVMNGPEAVSYTHLDVYKRQKQGNELGARQTVAWEKLIERKSA